MLTPDIEADTQLLTAAKRSAQTNTVARERRRENLDRTANKAEGRIWVRFGEVLLIFRGGNSDFKLKFPTSNWEIPISLHPAGPTQSQKQCPPLSLQYVSPIC